MAECSIDGCANVAKYSGTGWCQTHYHRYWRTGSTDILPKPMRTDLSYRGAHGRVRSTFGAASKYICVDCGRWANEWAYDGTDPSDRLEKLRVGGNYYPVTYSVWPEFYMPMCFPCHRGKDKVAWSERRTHCTNKHLLTPENVYTRPSRPGTKECRACKDEEYVRRRRAKGSEPGADVIARITDLTMNG